MLYFTALLFNQTRIFSRKKRQTIMSVKIRLKRTGGKNEPRFRLVVTDIRKQRDGKVIEYVGFYNPVKRERILNMDRINYWLGVGAKPSETVASMIKYAQKNTSTP
jgi:small subunit ribosomal protein S16